MTKAKKEELVAKYMKNIPALTEYQREWIRKQTAHYIFVDKDENGKHSCHCDRCNKDVDLGKTRHKEIVKCPSCGHEMQIMHNWRNLYPETTDWIAIPRTLDGNTFMLRYVLAWRGGSKHIKITEVARGVFNLKGNDDKYLTFEIDYDGEWKYKRNSYFTEYNIYNFRELCCLQANLYKPAMKRELKKLDGMGYFDNFSDFTKSYLYAHAMIGVLHDKKNIYEKLCKAGLTRLAQDDFNKWGSYWYRDMCIDEDNGQTSLVKMLGINKNQLKLLRENQTVDALKYIKLVPNADQETLDLIDASKAKLVTIRKIIACRFNVKKTLKYFVKSKCNHDEWLHYVDLLIRLRYRLDESYLYPRDFRKEDDRVAKEYNDNVERIRKGGDNLRNELIKNIADSLRNNKEIAEFFKGSNGLVVCVPETVAELKEEGKKLHNCLGTYVDKVARGETLIFFVRRIEDPTAPYIAMEYNRGEIVQCRFDYNKAVTDTKIIDFANALAKKLASQNILAA